MEEGELRDIYIHPDFAYGSYSSFGAGQALKARIELIHIKESLDEEYPNLLQPFDVMHLAPRIRTCEEYATLQKKYNYLCGMRTWLHYKQAEPLICLEHIIEHLLSNESSPPEDQEKDLVSLLNWAIYSKQPNPSKTAPSEIDG